MDILYVNDNPGDIALFAEALHHTDPSINLSYALSTSDALRKLNNYLSVPDKIFVACDAGSVEGLECVKQIKARSGLKHVPVIAVSSTLTPSLIDALNKLGVYNFLSNDALHSDMEPVLKVLLDSLSNAEKDLT